MRMWADLQRTGWIFWTWKNEGAPEWHMKDLLAAGIFPQPLTARKCKFSLSLTESWVVLTVNFFFFFDRRQAMRYLLIALLLITIGSDLAISLHQRPVQPSFKSVASDTCTI